MKEKANKDKVGVVDKASVEKTNWQYYIAREKA